MTFSCYDRLPLLGGAQLRDIVAEVLGKVRDRYEFALVGYIIMPEHVHLLMSEPKRGTPSSVLQVVKERTSRRIPHTWPHFWQKRFYDFNVWSHKKKAEKLLYMHLNPVKRGLVAHPAEWPWSSFGFYKDGSNGLVRIDPCVLEGVRPPLKRGAPAKPFGLG